MNRAADRAVAMVRKAEVSGDGAPGIAERSRLARGSDRYRRRVGGRALSAGRSLLAGLGLQLAAANRIGR